MMETCHLPDEECWEYLDPNSVKRGPFSSSRMAVWYEHEMLPEELAVRCSSAQAFVPIRELFHPPLQPFRSRPKPAPAAPKPAAKAPAAKAPMAAQPPAQPPSECNWQYIDSKGTIQGPFPSSQMALWHEHGMLPKSLSLRLTTDSAFSTVAEYFPSPLVPFKSSPAKPGASKKELPAATAAAERTPVTPGPTQPGLQVAGSDRSEQNFPAPLAKLFASAAQTAAASAAAPAQTAASAEPTRSKKDGKGKGKGKGRQPEEEGTEKGSDQPTKKGRGKKAAAQQQEAGSGWTWSAEHGWTHDESWWDWNSWSAWSENGDGWEHTGKHGGAEWKGQDAAIGAGKEKGSNAVQAAFGSLNWGPPFQEKDLFPEEPIRRVLDEGIVWEERWISPLAVRFSQGKIHPFFHERGPISEVMLQIKLKNDRGTRRIDPPFPPIRLLHLKEQGVLVTLDNRRLYALQRFVLQEWPQACLVKALCVEELTPTRLRAENRKFTNRLCGLQLEVESRSNAFDTFSWVTEAAHIEAPRFLRPAVFRAFDKAISLLPALVVHALVCQRMRPLLRSRWSGLRFLASLLPNPQKRGCSSKRLLLQHLLELSKPSAQVVRCPRFCVGYKAETVVSLSKGKSCVSSKLSLNRPLSLLEAPGTLSGVQQKVLAALLPMLCLPYARSALRGSTRDWVVGFLLVWGKVAAAKLKLDLP
eukprot:TRINITY_DN4104_c0_g1_i3.p1 TRINITY_DN4104_c0_g1~~TRINITY_DN4104_c0_g1_i3.p1  ORF type:complete len:697 (-),score=153.06 TRINITY_DN4104_c0_g1_i3:5-2095(-)